jgi:hypothetical protein
MMANGCGLEEEQLTEEQIQEQRVNEEVNDLDTVMNNSTTYVLPDK